MSICKRSSDDWILSASKLRRLEAEGILPSGPAPKRNFRPVDQFTKHKMLINEYLLNSQGSTKLLQRDTSKDKTDRQVLEEHHKFLWEEGEEPDSWGKKVAKKYYDKLFKEYCLSDLRNYKENKIALRWRTHEEVVDGKGQFICADIKCDKQKGLKSWEVNFGYMENKVKKNALVKIRLCPRCSYKLNYHHKRKEVKNEATLTEQTLDIQIKQEKLSQSEDEDPSNAQRLDSEEKAVSSNFDEPSSSKSIPNQSKSNPMASLESQMNNYFADLLM